jgi:Ni/Co efflux regulator RcnB
MNKLLLSAAALTLLAFPALTFPALAQQPNGFDLTHGAAQAPRPAPAQAERPARAERAAPAPQAAAPQQQAAPQQRGGGNRGGGDRGGDRGGNRGGSTNGFDLTHGMPQPAQQAAPQNRDRGHDNNRGNDNRGGFNGGRGDNRGGVDNRGNNGRGYGNGGRRDYSSFNNYHRSYNASRRFRAPAYRRPSGWYDRRWTFGEFLPSLFWSSNYWLNDYNTYDLPPPPYGAVWVRNGNDALLIDRDSGEIISIEYGVFY